MAVFSYVYSDTVMVVDNALYIFYENMCEYVLRAFLKKMYFVLLFNFWFWHFARAKDRDRERSSNRSTERRIKRREASVVSTFCAFGVRSLF